MKNLYLVWSYEKDLKFNMPIPQKRIILQNPYTRGHQNVFRILTVNSLISKLKTCPDIPFVWFEDDTSCISRG